MDLVNNQIKKREGVFVEKLNEKENIVININTGIIASIDSIGLEILNFLDESRYIKDIIQMIHNKFECELDIFDDIADFIYLAIDAGFVDNV